MIDKLHGNRRLNLPFARSYSSVHGFIREVCRVAWLMTCLPYPLDVTPLGNDGDVFDGTRSDEIELCSNEYLVDVF